jgi:Protein of unknown function (DUF3592)
MAQQDHKSTARRVRVEAALSGTLEAGEQIVAECRCQPPGAIQNQQQQPVGVVVTDRRLFVLQLDALWGRKVKEIALIAPISEMRSVTKRRSHPIATMGVPLVTVQIELSTAETLTFQTSGAGNRGLQRLADALESLVATDGAARRAAFARGEPMPAPPATAIRSPGAERPPKRPEAAKGWSRVKWILTIAGSLLALAFVAWSASVFVGDQVERYHIDHAGVLIQAKVVDHDHSDNGDGSGQDSLAVLIPACNCAVWVPTDNPGGHPNGSRIPVRYDPSNPSQVIVQVNEPSNWFDDLGVAFFEGWVALFALLLLVLGVISLRGVHLEDTRLRKLWKRVKKLFTRKRAAHAPKRRRPPPRPALEPVSQTPVAVGSDIAGRSPSAGDGACEWPPPPWVTPGATGPSEMPD